MITSRHASPSALIKATAAVILAVENTQVRRFIGYAMLRAGVAHC